MISLTNTYSFIRYNKWTCNSDGDEGGGGGAGEAPAAVGNMKRPIPLEVADYNGGGEERGLMGASKLPLGLVAGRGGGGVNEAAESARSGAGVGSSNLLNYNKFNIIPSIFGGTKKDNVREFLDEGAYIAAATLRPGADAYSRNKFNQAESDRIPSNRPVPDTRNQMWVCGNS